MTAPNDIKLLARQGYALLNTGDDAKVEEMFGLFHEGLGMYRTAFPDLKITVEGEVIVEGDTAACRWTFSGTHRGELQGIASTGKHVRVPGMEISLAR